MRTSTGVDRCMVSGLLMDDRQESIDNNDRQNTWLSQHSKHGFDDTTCPIRHVGGVSFNKDNDDMKCTKNVLHVHKITKNIMI